MPELLPASAHASDSRNAMPAGAFLFPTSYAQRRLWMLDQLQPGHSLYNVPIALRLQGELDPTLLEAAVNDVVRRHDSLRTCFRLNQDQPIQVVLPNLDFRLLTTSLSHLPEQQQQCQIDHIAQAEARQRFDLQVPPLFSGRLLHLSDHDYILLLTIHHIVFDGWSLSLFFHELASCYCTRREGRTPDLPDLAVQYGDYADWQHRMSETNAPSLSWWKQYLSGSPLVLELPMDRPRPALPTGNGGIEILKLPIGLQDSLEKLGREENATLYMTLLAAFQVLLHRHSGQEEFLIGTPVAGRSTPEIESLIGLFINTLVLRAIVSGEPAFRSLLRDVRANVLSVLEHEATPFEKLVEELRPDRNLSRGALFQVMFMHERYPLESVEWPGIQVEPLDLDSGTSKFDLTFYAFESSLGITVRAEYNSDIFDAITVRRMLDHYGVLLQGVASDPDQPVTLLPLLTETERRQLVVDSNQTRTEYPREETVHGLITRQVARSPDAIAVECERERLTYRQLENESDRMAKCLSGLGVGHGARVGICVERSTRMLVTLLAIFKTGGAYIPLDPSLPQKRLAYILHESGAQFVVTQRDRLDLLPRAPIQYLFLEEDWNGSNPAAGSTGTPVSCLDPAYLIYTSGSTGRPKGVAIPHRAVVNLLCSFQQTPGLGPEDVLLAVTTLSFDISVLELFLPLTVGARVVIASRDQAENPAQLAARLEDTGTTVMQATPSIWRMLLASGWTGSRNLRILCGGEALPRDLADRLLPRCGELWNLYGPTETTIWSSLARVKPSPNPVVIGTPIANTQFYILDQKLQLVPNGVAGELCIGGDGLALGYLNAPEQSPPRFIRNPFSAESDARLYRTGDLARRRNTGEIELLGRLDHQVKIRGHRIELGEIESALRSAPHVREALVMTCEETSGDPQLVAYIVPDNGTEPSAIPARLRRHLQKTVPEYMLPTYYHLLDRLPLNPSGKVDRAALPSPTHATSPAADSGSLRPGLECAIAEIWSEVLNVNPGPDDSFFDLGGHSLRMAQVQALLREKLGREIRMVVLFQHPTIRSLSEQLDGKNSAPGAERESHSASGKRPRTGIHSFPQTNYRYPA